MLWLVSCRPRWRFNLGRGGEKDWGKSIHDHEWFKCGGWWMKSFEKLCDFFFCVFNILDFSSIWGLMDRLWKDLKFDFICVSHALETWTLYEYPWCMLCFIVGKELKSSNVIDLSFIYVVYAYAWKLKGCFGLLDYYWYSYIIWYLIHLIFGSCWFILFSIWYEIEVAFESLMISWLIIITTIEKIEYREVVSPQYGIIG